MTKEKFRLYAGLTIAELEQVQLLTRSSAARVQQNISLLTMQLNDYQDLLQLVAKLIIRKKDNLPIADLEP